MNTKSILDWMQRHGTQMLLALALVFTVISNLLADRAAHMETIARQGAPTSNVSSLASVQPRIAQN